MRGPGVLYVGGLPEGVRESEIADIFDKVCAWHWKGCNACCLTSCAALHGGWPGVV